MSLERAGAARLKGTTVNIVGELLADTAAAAADFFDGLDGRPVGAAATLEELRA